MIHLPSLTQWAARRARKLGLGLIRKGLKRMPSALRHACYRNCIRLDPQTPVSLQFRVAETHDELAAAYRILHDAYVAMGYMAPDPSGMRITAWHALPTTTTLIALRDGEVVGTVSVIENGVLGLPLDRIFDTTAIKQWHRRVVEISALAIRKGCRDGGEVLFPMLKYLYTYCAEQLDCEQMLIAMHPDMADYYEGMFFFEPLGETVSEYSFVNDAPARGLRLDMKTVRARWQACYGTAPAHRNIYRYVFELPGNRYDSAGSREPACLVAPELAEHFFNGRPEIFAPLSFEEQRRVMALYPQGQHPFAFPAGSDRRRLPRPWFSDLSSAA